MNVTKRKVWEEVSEEHVRSGMDLTRINNRPFPTFTWSDGDIRNGS